VAKSTTRRHRADLPVSTPLTGVTDTLTSALATPVSAAGKGGLVVAVSSGLVAGVAIPGSAAIHTTREASTTTASIPLLGAADAAAASATAAVAAAPTATVDFEHDAFRPVVKHGTATTSAGGASRQVTQISRSLARAAYQAQVKAAAAKAAAAAAAAQRRAHTTTSRTSTAPKATTTAHTTTSTSTSSVVALASRYLGLVGGPGE